MYLHGCWEDLKHSSASMVLLSCVVAMSLRLVGSMVLGVVVVAKYLVMDWRKIGDMNSHV